MTIPISMLGLFELLATTEAKRDPSIVLRVVFRAEWRSAISVTLDRKLNCAAYPLLLVLNLDRTAEFVGNKFADHAGAVARSARRRDQGAPIFMPLEPQLCRPASV